MLLSETETNNGQVIMARCIYTSPGVDPAHVEKSLFRILCKCLFSEVTVQAVTELDNKAAHCHSPVP